MIDRLLDEDIPGPDEYESDKDLTQESLDRWHVGAYSPSLNERVEWIWVGAGWPSGRFTRDKRRAEQLSNEFVAIANTDPQSPTKDWEQCVWPGPAIAEQLAKEQADRLAYKPVEPLL
jgi:hypothetical protein